MIEHNRIKNISPVSFYILCLVVFAALAQWIIPQSQQSINPDNAYLTHAAMRLLSGGWMSEGFYDVNPPLSFLIYLPAAALVKYIGIPIYYAVFFYSCALIAISSTLLFLVMKKVRFFSESERHVTLCIFLLANTIATMNFFAERDQFIALALIPLFFLQLSITHKDHVPPFLKWGILIFAGIFIFLKPHYGLIPASLFLHRMIKQKKINILFDHDFIGLACATAIQLAILFLCFPDFITIILPDIIAMYVIQTESTVNSALFEYGFSLFIVAIVSCLFFNKPYNNALAFFAMAALCLIVYYLMQKGFLYQLIPFMIFFSIGVGLLLHKILSELILTPLIKHHASNTALIIVSLLFIAGYYTALSPKEAFLTHEQYKNSPLTQTISACPKENCSFFMFNDRIDIMHEASVYADQPLATRFPTFFFLPFLLESNPSAFPPDIRPAYIEKYTNMVADDFEKYKPETLLIGRFRFEEGKDYFDFLNFFKAHNPRFTDIFNHYTQEKNIEVDQNAYTGSIFITTKKVIFDVYRRND